ncbi:DUF6049 family protein [Streptomyces sp. TP-A0874]|uniref:DUF6049 family protein n=1 Tax=Streptomyces sp. TP-A0874 TaxID=549819 RepID=UPI0009A08306
MAEAAQFQGTSSVPARRWLRRGIALLAATPLLAGVLQLPAPETARAAETASSARSVKVSIDSLSPAAPAKSDTITLTGTVTNDTRSKIDDASIGLRLTEPLNSRSAVDAAAKRKGYSYAADGHEVGGGHTLEIDKLPSGGSRSFSLSVPVKDLELGASPAVYQLGVSLTGHTANQPVPQVLGIARTFLPWQPSQSGKKTRISYMWPLISGPRLSAETASDPQQTPRFRDDTLAEELAPGGRLQQLVELGKDLPVSWVIDPDLLVSVEAMTGSYKVEQPDGSVKAGKDQELAKKWLGELTAAVKDREVVALPFADPDLASLAHQGKDVSGALSHLKPATDLGSLTVETILGRKPRTDFAWPVAGALDSSIVDVATSAGAHNLIARGDSLRDPSGLPYTPTAARPIGGGNTVLVADTGLSKAFQGGMSSPGSSVRAVQRFLAQTLMISMQSPDTRRSIVVAPDRMPSAEQAQSMARAVEALKDGDWMAPLDLGDAANAAPDPQATDRVPGPRSYPGSLRKQELPTAAFEEIQGTQSALTGFQVVLSQPDRVVTPFSSAIMRGLSTSWRGDAEAATVFRSSVQEHLSALTQGVRLIQKSKQTLSGRSATIPVTVENNLVQGVKGLKLKLTSSQPNRLDVGTEQPVLIEGEHSQSVKFPTTANANGFVWVKAQLYTEDGTPYGAPMTFQVNVTEITSTVMLVIAGGVLLLVLAGVRMYTQRKRRAALAGEAGEPPEAGAEAGAESDTENRPEDGPEQPGDQAADTGPESGDAPGPGEKVDR